MSGEEAKASSPLSLDKEKAPLLEQGGLNQYNQSSTSRAG